MKSITSFILAAVVLAAPSPGRADNGSANAIKAGAYEVPMMAEWRVVAPPKRMSDAAVDITLSASEDTCFPGL